MKKYILVLAVLVILFLFGTYLDLKIPYQSNIQIGNSTLSLQSQETRKSITPIGKILVRVQNQESHQTSSIIAIDGDGNNIRVVGNYEGSPTWSPNGQYIAVGCVDGLCILDFKTSPDRLSNLQYQNTFPNIVKTISMPSLCRSNINYGAGEPYSGILSMSWSPNGKNLAVVCGSEDTNISRSVCTYDLNGGETCWNEGASKNINRVAWSPVDQNVIAVAEYSDNATSKIKLVDSKGKNSVFLAYGWSPEWSPTGDQIAFINSEPPEHLGIAIINRDGTNKKWLQLSTPVFFYFDCHGFSGSCRLSWSPDNQYITFVSSNAPGTYVYRLYRVDIKTGDVIQLIDNLIFKYVAEPDWGP